MSRTAPRSRARRAVSGLILAAVATSATVALLARLDGDATAGGRDIVRPDAIDLVGLDPVPVSTWGVSDSDPSGTQTPWLDVLVWDMKQAGERMFIGGAFLNVTRSARSPSIRQPYLAAFDTRTGEWVEDCRPSFDRAVYSMAINSRGMLIVGGEFETVNGVARSGIVALDPESCEIDETFGARVERPWSSARAMVRDIEIVGQDLYAVGLFSHVEGPQGLRVRVDKAVRLNESDGTVDPSWTPRLRGSSIWGVAADIERGRVHLAGFHTSTGTDAGGHFSTVDIETGVAVTGPTLSSGACCGHSPETYDVAVISDAVAVAAGRRAMQLIDGATGEVRSAAPSGFTCPDDTLDGCGPGGHDIFQVVEAIDGKIIAGCDCAPPETAEEPGASLLMAFDPATGDPIEGFAPDIGSRRDGVWSIASDTNGCLYVGGDLDVAGVAAGSPRWLGGFAKLCRRGWSAPTDGTDRGPAEPTEVTATRTHTAVEIGWTPGANPPDTADSYTVMRNGTYLGRVDALRFAPRPLADFDSDAGGWSGAVLMTPDRADQTAPVVGSEVALLSGNSRVRSDGPVTVFDPVLYRFAVSVTDPARSGADHDAGRFVARILAGDTEAELVEVARDELGESELVSGVWSELSVVARVAADSAVIGRGVWLEVEHFSVGGERRAGFVDGPRFGPMELDPAPRFVDAAPLGALGAAEVVYAVTANDIDGRVSAPASAPPVAVEEMDAVPTPPVDLRATRVGDEVRLRWGAPAGEVGRVAGYEIWRDGIWWASVDENQLTTSDLGVPSGRSIEYRVASVDAAGRRSSFAEPALVDAGERTDGPPAVVGDVTAAIVDGGVSVVWDASTGPDGTHHRYLVYRNGSFIGWAPAGTASFVDRSPGPHIGSSYRVRAIDHDGRAGPKSEAARPALGTVDETPPSVPEGLVATVSEDGVVTLTWNPTTDGESGVESHLVYVDGSYVGWTRAGATSFVVGGLSPGVTVELTVRSSDVAGNRSATAPPISVTPPG